MQFTLRNSRNSIVSVVNTGETTGNSFPITVIGYGVAAYPEIVASNEYKLLENFANSTAPVNPVEGMIWYRSDTETPYYYNGTSFFPFGTATSSGSVLFSMLPAATNMDLTQVGSTAIFQAGSTGATYHPTAVMLIPNGNPTAVTPPVFNLYVSASEDIMENAVVQNVGVGQHAYYSIEGTVRHVRDGESIQFEVTTAATGGTSNYDVYVFGFTRT